MKSINETHYTLTFKCIFRQNWLENQGILFFVALSTVHIQEKYKKHVSQLWKNTCRYICNNVCWSFLLHSKE